MKTSQAFYQALNSSIEKTNNARYIEQTNAFMKSILYMKKNVTDVLILGAGNMFDLSLDFFLDNFKTVTLSDIDIMAVKNHLGVHQHNQRIVLKETDYLALDVSTFFLKLEDCLKKSTTSDELIGLINQIIDDLLNHQFSHQYLKRYDVIYVSPIYTQLLFRQAETMVKALYRNGLSKEFHDIAIQALLQNMIRIIDHFNKQVKELAKKQGIIFVASDIFLLGDDEFSKKLIDSIKNYDVVEELYRDYHKVYGYGLGDYGLDSATNLFDVIGTRWYIWHQSKQQTYAVKFRAFEKIND